MDERLPHQMSSTIVKGVTYASDKTTVLDCLFCRIIAGKEPSSAITPPTPNPNLYAFKTINPATSLHLLISPVKHIKNVDALTPSDLPLLEEMKAFGASMLTEQQQKDALFVFHMPPWNSIDHLHLHVIAERSTMTFFNGYFKYLPGTAWCQSVDSIITKLRR